MRIRPWTIILAIIITLSLGLILPTFLFDNQAAVEVTYEQKKQKAATDFKTELTNTITAVEQKAAEAESITQPTGEANSISNPTNQQTNKPTETSVSNPTNQQTTQPTSEQAVIIEDESIALAEANVYVKDEWVNQKIQENRDNIEDKDLNTGAAIYNTLDTNLLFSYADEGLTEEEKVKVDEYLKSQLSGTDYEIAKDLYYKYVGLLNND